MIFVNKRAKFTGPGQSLLASLSDGWLPFGCTAHYGQTAEVKSKL